MTVSIIVIFFFPYNPPALPDKPPHSPTSRSLQNVQFRSISVWFSCNKHSCNIIVVESHSQMFLPCNCNNFVVLMLWHLTSPTCNCNKLHSLKITIMPVTNLFGRFREGVTRWVSKPEGFPLFSGKVRIVSQTLSKPFLVGAFTRNTWPRKRKRTNRENPRKIQEKTRKCSCVFPVEPHSPNGKNINLHKKWGFRRFQKERQKVRKVRKK